MPTNEEAAERRALRTRRRLRQLLGAVVCLFVLLGIGSVATTIYKTGAKLFDNSAEKLSYEIRLATLVALDPVPFDSLSDANTGTLLNAAIWGTINGTDSQDYEHDEAGAMYLPTVDIDLVVSELYGPDFKFNYQTFTDRGLTYNYVPEKEAYLIPITSAITDYSPRVEKIKREGNTKRVTVGYISPYDENGALNLTGVFVPVKYNDFIFTKVEGKYYLSAIVASAMKAENPASSGNSNTTAQSVDPQDALTNITPEIIDESFASVSGAEESNAKSVAAANADAAESTSQSGQDASSASASGSSSASSSGKTQTAQANTAKPAA